jgi:hypothetical protein
MPRQDAESVPDLNALVPLYMAATPELRGKALALLRGQAPDGQGLSGEESDGERMLTQQELASKLRIHETTVRRWGIPCHRLGRVPRYLLSEVRPYLESPAFKNQLAQLKAERGVCQ